MTTPAKITEWRASPKAFVLDLMFPTRNGPRRFGDIATEFQIAWLDVLAPAFLAIANGEAPPTPKVWIEASKGCSKTTLIAALLIWLLIFSRRPGNGIAGAVDRDNAGEVLRACKELLHESDWLAEQIEIQTWAIIGNRTGVVIEITASDRKGTQGGRPLVTYVDECGHIEDGPFEYVENLLDNAAKTGGLTLICTNAGWTGTKAHALREIARTSPLWTFLSWNRPSPLTPQAEIDEAKLRNSPGRFNRLYFTIWGPRDEGDALNAADREACITRDRPCQKLPSGFGFAVIGVDAGLKHDRTGVATVAIDLKTAKVCLMETRSWRAPIGGEVQIADVEAYIIDAARRFHAARIVVDVWALESTIQRFRLMGLPIVPIHPSPANADLLAVKIVAAFRERQLALYPDAELLEDLGKFSIVEKNSAGFGQTYKLVAPRDSTGHADLGQAYLMAATQALVFADGLRSQRAFDASEAAERHPGGDRDPNWGKPMSEVDQPFNYLNEYPNLRRARGGQ